MNTGKSQHFNYFTAYNEQAAYAHELACNLQSAVEAGELGRRELMDALHVVENDADQVNHTIHEHLLADFVVPLERIGMGEFAGAMDDMCDAIEDIAIRAYCLCFTDLGDAGKQILKFMATSTDRLEQVVKQLDGRGWKDPEIKRRLIEVQEYESECDKLYIDAVHDLYSDGEMDSEMRRRAHAVLDSLENAMDAIENAAECIDSLIANNM